MKPASATRASGVLAAGLPAGGIDLDVRPVHRLDAHSHNQNRLQLLDRVGLRKKGRVLHKERFHSVGNGLTGCIKDLQLWIAFHGLFRQIEADLAMLVKPNVNKQEINFRHVKNGQRLVLCGSRKGLVALLAQVRLGQHPNLLLVLYYQYGHHSYCPERPSFAAIYTNARRHWKTRPGPGQPWRSASPPILTRRSYRLQVLDLHGDLVRIDDKAALAESGLAADSLDLGFLS